ncbi:MAG: VOC family protein [Myxococcales bacterium]
MLNQHDATANVAVRDLMRAKSFYGHTLGLEEVDAEGEEVVVYRSGHSNLNVYRSDFAGTNQATAVTWSVPDIEDTVKTLKAKGVKFEHYDMPGLSRRGDIHAADGMKVAWFRDPDGNILNLVSR